jgi:DNA repair exonuclease SbcCD ATPase subunit
MVKARHIVGVIVITLWAFMLLSCGDSIFYALSSKTIPNDPYLALEQAEDLYLSGKVAKANDFYGQLEKKYKDDPEYQDVYHDALRGKSKCVLELPPEGTSKEESTQDSEEAIEIFIDFAMSIDTEDFSLKDADLDTFRTVAADYQSRLNTSFDTLANIDMDARTEGDYANLSISGVISVLFIGVDFFIFAADKTSTIMNKIDTLNKKIDEFNSTWEEYEDDPTNTDIQQQLEDLAKEIDDLYKEIEDTLDNVIDTMQEVKEEGNRVEKETKPAENEISVMLNGVLASMTDAVEGALPGMEEIDNQSGDFYEHWDDALKGNL